MERTEKPKQETTKTYVSISIQAPLYIYSAHQNELMNKVKIGVTSLVIDIMKQKVFRFYSNVNIGNM